MAESFFINVNCSRILPESGATNFTMFIDCSKMSIVYELVEWIRWMFSLDTCLYLMHENSVIHELEDVQLLAKLKNFEIMPCGQPQCIHTKLYRTLLQNLNLIVSWNETKVHKYFLDKINQMSQKLNQGRVSRELTPSLVNDNSFVFDTINSSKNFHTGNGKIDSHESEVNLTDLNIQKQTQNSFISPINRESPSKRNQLFDKVTTEKEKVLHQLEKNFSAPNMSNTESKELKNPENLNLSYNSTYNNTKKDSKTDGVIKANLKPKTFNRHTRPFSLGALLTNIRQDLERKKGEMQSSENVFQETPPLTAENPEKEVTFENSLIMLDKATGDKKRQRTRKRKRSKKQIPDDDPFTSYTLENKKGLCSLNISNSDISIKPNHIRFDDEPEDYNLESERASEHHENGFEVISTEVGNTPEFVTNPTEMSICNGDEVSHKEERKSCSQEKINANLMELLPVFTGNQIAEEEKLVEVSDGCENVNQSFSPLEHLNSFNQDLSELLSFKDKFKKGIVIQRFY